MRTILMGSAAMLLALTTAAQAQDAPPPLKDPSPPTEAGPTPPLVLTGAITGVTDYRFRGISQSNSRVALQGTFNLTHESGFYIGTWASTIDDYVAAGSDAEIDVYGGYKRTFGGTTVDGGLLYYFYPKSTGANTDFFEPYINASHAFGPLTAKVGGNFAWKQKELGLAGEKRSGAYGYGELTANLGDTGISLTGHYGHSFKRNYITLGERYSDYSLTAAYTYKGATLSAAYVDASKRFQSYPTGGGINRNIGGSGAVVSIGFAF